MRDPDALDAARVLALAVAAMAIAMAMVGLGAPPVVASVFQQAAFLAAPLLYARRAGLRPFAASGFVPMPLRRVAFVLVASFGSFWLLNGLVHVQKDAIRSVGLEKVAQKEEQHIREGIEEARKEGLAPALALFVLIPPLCEETFFRGIVFRGLLQRFGIALALGGTTVLFAFLHLTVVQWGLMLFLGCYFGLLVYLTGSLWSSVIAHALNNLAVIVLMAVYEGKLPEMTAPWWMYVLSGIVFALGMTLLALDRRADPTSLKR